MKPGAAWREEPWWHWDWPGRPGSYLSQGTGVQNLSASEQPRSEAANLWVPDPEARRGWREYYVYHDPPPPPPGRKLGL